MNQVMQMLTNNLQQRLRSSNPQMFSAYEQMRKSNGNPMDFFKQVTNSYTPEQMQSFMGFAKQMGIPDNVLSQIQNTK